ncbi:zinc finger domain-containing phd-finger [Colletotrichum musicola]|uniref:Zinc finger domain-containing phd-finger n=1 Tax=Colletotrichum musicola TaxID=2175873 RepID=A0A8H6NNI2_9PEZI|nr:zinc finger domain-containing phd-finger [Colletotrichum musicola]
MTAQSRRQRSTPYLQRNLLQGMGNSQSSAQKAAAASGIHEDDDDKRAAKRRRVDAGKAPAHALSDQIFHARELGDRQRNLCVQVNKIVHKDSKRVSAPATEDTVRARARCRISVSHMLKSGHEQHLHCDSQMCEIKSFKDPGGPLRVARVILPRPFYVPRDKIRINREDQSSFDLADAYRLCIELEAAGPTYWPPIVLNSSAGEELGRSQKADALQWVFHAALSDLYTKTPMLLNLKVKKSPDVLVTTEHLIEVDVTWATAFEATAIRPLEEGVEPSITVHPDVAGEDPSLPCPPIPLRFDSPPGTPAKGAYATLETPVKSVQNGLLNGIAHEEEEPEEELTPNRSLRVRGPTKNYNLKVLSDKAQGKERKRKKRQTTVTTVVEEGNIVYHLPEERVSLDSFRCITCGLPNISLQKLHAHLVNQHAEYNYKQVSSGRSVEYNVTHRFESYAFGAQSFSFHRPAKVYDLDQFADGSLSFSASRFEPELDGTEAIQPQGRSRQPAANPPQTRTKLLIPDIKQTLYDPITRATLEPGTEYKKPTPSDQWLTQWHRDALADFSDVPPNEIEYMQEWDQFMLTKRISSNIYFPPAWLSFVKLKVDWLLSSPTRMIEFGKHISYLLARSSLDHDTVQEALDHIATRRATFGKTNGDHTTSTEKEPPLGPHIRRSAGGCQVCGLTVLGPRLLLCANSDCAKRLYHSDCISENAKKSISDPNWICNKCFDKRATEQT